MWQSQVELSKHTLTYSSNDHGGLVLQLDGSAPIFSPRSTRSFILSLMKVPATGGNQSLGIDTIYTSAFVLP